MKTNKKIKRDKILAKIYVFIGAVLLCSYGFLNLIFIENIVKGEATDNLDFIISFIFFGLPGLALLIKSINNKRIIYLFKNYVTTMSAASNGSISNIAKITGKSENFVKNKISKMIKNKYFTDARIEGDQLLINGRRLTKVEKLKVVNSQCKTCGAIGRNVLTKNSFCEYCGSKL